MEASLARRPARPIPDHRNPAPAHTPAIADAWRSSQQRIQDRQFLTMARTFSRTGGLCDGDEAARMLRANAAQPVSKLARMIVDRHVVSFHWQAQIYLPLFQFDTADMSLRPGLADTLVELVEAFDAWDLAHWFAEPNSWLPGRLAPAELLASDPAAVHQAARADRYIALG